MNIILRKYVIERNGESFLNIPRQLTGESSYTKRNINQYVALYTHSSSVPNPMCVNMRVSCVLRILLFEVMLYERYRIQINLRYPTNGHERK